MTAETSPNPVRSGVTHAEGGFSTTTLFLSNILGSGQGFQQGCSLISRPVHMFMPYTSYQSV